MTPLRLPIPLLAIVAFAACAPVPSDVPPEEDPPATSDDDDSPPPPPRYAGPAYAPCVTDAQCDPGSACTGIPGWSGLFCAPACDPDGDAAECLLLGWDLDAVCLDSGRCARRCASDESPVAPLDEPPPPPTEEELAARDPNDPLCPEGLTCRTVDDSPLCAGEPAGSSGFYGICSHPNVPGTDCPIGSSCFGGGFIGVEAGVCLPWCDDGTTCPAPVGTSGVTPYCYDVSGRVEMIDHPLCALLCSPGSEDSLCPEAQYCIDVGFGGVGLCGPEGAESPL